MTEIERRESVYDLVQKDVTLRGEVSTARTMNRVSGLLAEALRQSGLTGAEIAEQMDVSASRVSQILGEPANLRLSTIARFLNAAGFEPQIQAVALSDRRIIDGPPKPQKRKRKRGRTPSMTVFAEEIPSTEPHGAPVRRIILQDSSTSRTTDPAKWVSVGEYPHKHDSQQRSGGAIRSWATGGSR